MNYQTLTELLGYSFNDQQLLIQALTHRSVEKPNNERLEFLGDAVLQMIISDKLFKQFPKEYEGSLSHMRSMLVNRQTLADIARKLSLGRYLILGHGELKSKGFLRDSLLANSLEAIIAAIYLDSNFNTTQRHVVNWYQPQLTVLLPTIQLKDHKTRLQEWLQAKQYKLPCYTIVATHGADHEQQFIVECKTESLSIPIQGKGSSRRKAEQVCAKIALEQLL